MSDQISHSRRIIGWFKTHVRPIFQKTEAAPVLEELDKLAGQVEELERNKGRLFPICLLGQAGVGKSTLINTLIADTEIVVPSGGGTGPLTANALRVIYGERRAFAVRYHSEKQVNQTPGQLHMKSRTEEDLQEIVLVAGGDESFVFDTDFVGEVVFEQAQSGSAEQAEVGGGVTFAEAGLIFLERHVELPMQLVLDAPVTANGLGEAAGGQLFTEDVVPHFDGLLPVASGLVERHADRGELGPARAIGQVQGRFTDAGHASLLAAVSPFVSLVTTALDPSEAIRDRAQEEGFDPLVQRGLIALHGQDVVGLRGHDVASDVGLTTHRVDRHQTAGKLEHLQQLRDRSDLIAFVSDHHLAQRNPIRRGPRADHVNGGFAAGRIEAALSLNYRVRSLHPRSSLGGRTCLPSMATI